MAEVAERRKAELRNGRAKCGRACGGGPAVDDLAVRWFRGLAGFTPRPCSNQGQILLDIVGDKMDHGCFDGFGDYFLIIYRIRLELCCFGRRIPPRSSRSTLPKECVWTKAVNANSLWNSDKNRTGSILFSVCPQL